MAATPCPQCGKVLPLDAPKGLCPTCLFSGALKWVPPSAQPAQVEPPPARSEKPGRAKAPETKIRVFGDYELLAEIARSGVAIVYRARQRSRNRWVALKVLRADQPGVAAAMAPRHHEMKAVARLKHPNILPIYEVGEHDGHHYFSTKLLEGGTLAHHLACRSGSDSTFTEPPPKKGSADFNPPPAQTPARPKRAIAPPAAASPSELRTGATLLAKVARAIHFAHQHGLLHGNLRPSNILLDRNDHPYVAGFGEGSLPRDFAHPANSLALTAGYLPPDQAQSNAKPLTTAADIYSLGAILYEVLTGRPPFRADSETEVLRQVIEEAPEPPQSLNQNVDSDLQTICLRCLEKKPEKRYRSAEAFASDLERWLVGKAIAAPAISLGQRIRRWCQRKPGTAR